jgi:mannose-6-phosphate isomerase-like protein (cupin superfamily)
MQTQSLRTIENPIIKDRVTFIETAAETDGKYTAMLLDLAPNGRNELHTHKSFDEIFTVCEGRLGLQLGSAQFILEVGESVRVKAGDEHCFFNPSNTERAVAHVMLDTASKGLEISLQVAYGLARDGRTNRKGIPYNPLHLAMLVHWSDTNLPRLLWFLEPVMRCLKQLAVWKGIDQALIRQYVRI